MIKGVINHHLSQKERVLLIYLEIKLLDLGISVVYKILLRARPSSGKLYGHFLHDTLLYARYLCSRDALGQARRATIGYLVYKIR